jgi:hypothetical protein
MQVFDSLEASHSEFIRNQHVYFVATAPLSAEGFVNLSPKGLDSFEILGPNRVAYVDLGGSGIETHAHVIENGRICLMFCAFEDKPLILRLYGRGSAHAYGSAGFEALRDRFSAVTSPVRGIIEVEVTRVQTSCGWGVPLFEYKGDRETLPNYTAKWSQEDWFARTLEKNAESIDGLPGLRGESR